VFPLLLAALPLSLAGHAGHAGRPAQQQVDWATVEVKAAQVRGNIWVLSTDYGGNIGVSVGEDGTLIVDDQFAPLAEKIRAALKGVGGGELKFILNTHYHGDHTGGNKEFGGEATIIAHDNVRKRLSTPPADAAAQGRWAEQYPRAAWPVITFGERVSIHFNGEEIRALHYPQGHTDGDSVIFFTQSNVVHMGDDFFHARFPYVDLNAGGTVQGLTKNIADILSKLPADVKIIPGHGPVCGIEDLKTYHRMLLETTAHVQKQKQAGKTLEEVKAAGVPEEWKGWTWRFISTERWLETVYKSLGP
jgi:glyoxylase-like metal-dependent hydrolase (beta-lactamase superfamily II)